MLSQIFLRIMGAAKIFAWIAFGCLCILALILIPVSIGACSNPSISKAYIGFSATCIIYLFLYFALKFYIFLFPWWSKRKNKTKIAVYLISVLLVITITTVSVVVPFNKKSNEFTNRFQTNWKTNILINSKFKYGESWTYGFAGGHDELAYAVYKPTDIPIGEITSFVPNRIFALEVCHRMELDRIQKDNPNLAEIKYAEIYFYTVLKNFNFSVPKRFLPDWDNESVCWLLRGGIVENRNQKSTAACLFAVYDKKTGLLILFEYIAADH